MTHPVALKDRAFLAAGLGAFILGASTLAEAQHAQGATESIWPTKEWQMSLPEEQGMDSKELIKLVDFGTTDSLDSLLVVRRGKIVAEAYYAPYTAEIPHAVYSVVKAVISTVIAIASKDGLLDSPSHRVLDFFDRRSFANVDDRKEAITVQTLLDMTSGIEWKQPPGGWPESMFEMERSPDWVKFVLDRPMASIPGDVFYYSNGNGHLLSAIVTKLSGMSALEYAKAKLFNPLGINKVSWVHDPQGISNGGRGLYLQTRDMAKIGYLWLCKGAWQDKQLFSSAWLDKVTHGTVDPQVPGAPELRYSNLFWVLRDKHVYAASGYHDQVIMVFPDLDIVAVTTGRDNHPLSTLAGYISSSVKSDKALTPDPESTSLLAHKILDVSAEKPDAVGATPDLAATISGRVYRFPPNAINVKSLSLTLTDGQARYDMEIYAKDETQSGLRITGPIGLDGRYRKGEPTYLRESAIYGVTAVKGTWVGDHAFVIDRLIIGEGQPAARWTLTFDGKKLNIRTKFDDGQEVSVDSEIGS